MIYGSRKGRGVEVFDRFTLNTLRICGFEALSNLAGDRGGIAIAYGSCGSDSGGPVEVGGKDISESLFSLKKVASRFCRRLRMMMSRMMAIIPATATTAEVTPMPTLKDVFWVVGMEPDF